MKMKIYKQSLKGIKTVTFFAVCTRQIKKHAFRTPSTALWCKKCVGHLKSKVEILDEVEAIKV
jgi:hypothetical protein